MDKVDSVNEWENKTDAVKQNAQLDIQLIGHASVCTLSNCNSNCTKMKQLLKHERECEVKVSGNCKLCLRIWNLFHIHAQRCNIENCQIPLCLEKSGQVNECTNKKSKLSIQLIEHAVCCKLPKCDSNCAKMKKLLNHELECTVKVSGGCTLCKKVWNLIRIHAQQCENENCPVPQCRSIHERFYRLAVAKQQQPIENYPMPQCRSINESYHGLPEQQQPIDDEVYQQELRNDLYVLD